MFSSVQTQLCPALFNPKDCSMPAIPVHHQLSEFAQTHVHQVGDASSSVVHFSSCLQSFPATGSFPMSQFLTSGGQRIGSSASASVHCSHFSLYGLLHMPSRHLIALILTLIQLSSAKYLSFRHKSFPCFFYLVRIVFCYMEIKILK